jgi:rubrerythrin
MESLEELKKQRDSINADLAKVNEKIENRIAATIVRCPNKDCLRGYEVRELEYIQTHWYDPPSSCTDGDCWYAGEGRWKCPVCGAVTRLYDKPDITALKQYFKSVVDKYDR